MLINNTPQATTPVFKKYLFKERKEPILPN